jgi:hypothetical protein
LDTIQVPSKDSGLGLEGYQVHDLGRGRAVSRMAEVRYGTSVVLLPDA